MAVSDVQMFRSLARAAISSSLDCVNPCGLPPEDRLLLSMSPHVLVPGAWEQEERNAAQKQQEQQQQQQQQRQSAQQRGSLPMGLQAAEQVELAADTPAIPHLPGSRTAVAGVTAQQHTPAATPPSAALEPPATGATAATDGDPLGAEPANVESNGPDASGAAAAQTEPEFTDPLRRRTLQGNEGLLGEEVGLSEDGMAEEEGQDAAALAALKGLPRATQGLQLYDR